MVGNVAAASGLLGDPLRMGEGRQIKKLENVAKATNALEDEIAALDDEEPDHFTGNGKAHNVPLLYVLRWIGA